MSRAQKIIEANGVYDLRFGDVARAYSTPEGDIVLNFDFDTGGYTLSLHTKDNKVKHFTKKENIGDSFKEVSTAMKKAGVKIMPKKEFQDMDSDVNDAFDDLQDDEDE